MSLEHVGPREWPYFLTAISIGHIIGCSRSTAERKMRRGEFGPVIKCCKMMVTRDDFLKALDGMKLASPTRPSSPRFPRGDEA